MFKYDSTTKSFSLQSRLAVGYQGSAGIYHPQKNALRFFGGQALFDKLYSQYSKYYSFEFVLDSTSWSPSAPRENNLVLYNMAAVYNQSNYVVVHGGLYPDSLGPCITGETRILDLACNTWTNITTTQLPRMGHSVIQRGSILYIFGGNDGTLKNQVDEIILDPFVTARSENECIGKHY